MQNAAVRLTAPHVLKKSPNIVERKIYSSYFLIDITDNYSENKCSLYEINDVGSFIWNGIDGHRTITDIAVMLQNAIIDEVELQILINDICEFADSLMSKRFVEV